MSITLGMTEAPWTDKQVAHINYYQRARAFHPFTCECEHPQRNARLVATNTELRCDHCHYTQTWVYDEMADGSAMKTYDEMVARLKQ